MSHENEPKQRLRHPDRISLEPELLNIIDAHIEQATKFQRGIRLNRKSYLKWRLERFPKELTSSEIEEIANTFYDEEKLLRDVLNEVKLAKARGEKISVKTLLVTNGQLSRTVRKKRKQKESSEKTTNDTTVDSSSATSLAT